MDSQFLVDFVQSLAIAVLGGYLLVQALRKGK